MEAFSDGVFAIAITLLVLEISVPDSAFDDLWRAIVDQWPSYLAYVTSFLTIGGLWLVHHAIVRRVRYADPTVMRLNLVLLMLVAFLPFPTNLMADALVRTDAERPAVLFYGATLLVISVLITAMGRYVARRGALLHTQAARTEVEAVAALTAPNLAFYVLVLVLALVAPRAAAFGFLAVALQALRPARSGRAAPPAG